jgi:hypothetical protein
VLLDNGLLEANRIVATAKAFRILFVIDFAILRAAGPWSIAGYKLLILVGARSTTLIAWCVDSEIMNSSLLRSTE